MAKAKIDKFGRTRYEINTEQAILLANTMDAVMMTHYRGGFATEKARESFVEDLISALESLCECNRDNEKLYMDHQSNLKYVKKHTSEMANHYPENYVPSREEVLAYYAEK